ncbi:MAG: hydroxymethylglutaryl-CoA reductase, degradative, partial [Gammaproteobacteria bacterium]|nr:hydroxymethylglutaryl-CoA reductase, degradative [Gammaproteobacteria bacterium]
MSNSRISGLYRLSVAQRIARLHEAGWLSAEDADALQDGRQVINVRDADRMIENVIGVFGLPMAIAPNFCVNRQDYIVPLVVEEPSIVAALSSSAGIARKSGGFFAACDESLAIGQIHLTDIDNSKKAIAAIDTHKQSLLDDANAVHPRLVARGGGVRDIEVYPLDLGAGKTAIAVHLLVDTRDAMGANLVNTLCESIAPRLALLCDATVAMRILSNLADRSLATAQATYRLQDLADDLGAARKIRDAIVRANDIAIVDRYRAVTHNKGILNGIDPLAIATGNDWRAIEAGAHAYASKDGHYTALTEWKTDDDGDLVGRIKLPLKVGIVGGTLGMNRAALLGLRICGVESAGELAGLMAAVGLAQNFAAIKALTTSGIQKGHMRMHARSVAAAAGVPDDLFDDVVAELVDSGEVKSWKARDILRSRQLAGNGSSASSSSAGKVILLGEHAAVHGRHALAVPIENAMSAVATTSKDSWVRVPAWGVDEAVNPECRFFELLRLVARELGIGDAGVKLTVRSSLPPGMGLGASAAFAVCTTRAIAAAFEITIDDKTVNRIAFECEKLAHGTPSGVDNTVSTYAAPILFQRTDEVHLTTLQLNEAPPLVVACSNSAGST